MGIGIMAWINFTRPRPAEESKGPQPQNYHTETRASPGTEVMPVNTFFKNNDESRASSGIRDFSLDTIGQQNEIVRFRISEMLDRLERVW
ncbi:MAG: hypothetical protein EOO38_24505 [Cytophagaceae bacterium]|nr:MAG: hypothetical protein EOO38_24505 [Cytophagaceae bacterium]